MKKERKMKKVLFPILALVLALGLALPMAAVVGAQPADTIYGITNTGSIHEVDPISGSGTEIDTVVDCPTGGSGPNGLAYDQDTNRIYYLEYPDQAYTGYAKDGYASLYFTDLDTGDETFAGLLEGEIADADIYEGHYYYIAGGTSLGFTDDLYKVQLLADGTVGTITEYPDISAPDNHAYGFWGDIAIQDGVIYGNGDCKVSGHNYEFFRVNCDGTGFEKIAETSWGLQLAFGLDGTLYGHDFSGGKFYTITWTDTSVTRTFLSNSSHQYTDCASGMTASVEVEVEKNYRYTNVCFERDNDLDGLFNEDPVDLVDNDLDGLIDEDPVDCPEGTDLGARLPMDNGNYVLEAVIHPKNSKVTSYNPGQYYAVSTVTVLDDVETLTIFEDWDGCTTISTLNPRHGGGSVVIVQVGGEINGPLVPDPSAAYQIMDATSPAVTISGNTAKAVLEDVKAGTIILMYVKFGPGLKGETWEDTVGPCENYNRASVLEDPDPLELGDWITASANLIVVEKE